MVLTSRTQTAPHFMSPEINIQKLIGESWSNPHYVHEGKPITPFMTTKDYQASFSFDVIASGGRRIEASHLSISQSALKTPDYTELLDKFIGELGQPDNVHVSTPPHGNSPGQSLVVTHYFWFKK